MTDLRESARHAIAKLTELLRAHEQLDEVREEVRQAQIECEVWSFQIERVKQEAKEFRERRDKERHDADLQHRQEMARHRQELHGVLKSIAEARQGAQR